MAGTRTYFLIGDSKLVGDAERPIRWLGAPVTRDERQLMLAGSRVRGLRNAVNRETVYAYLRATPH